MSLIGPNNFMSSIRGDTCYIVVKMFEDKIIEVVSAHSTSESAHEYSIMNSQLKVIGPVPFFHKPFTEPKPKQIMDFPPKFNPGNNFPPDNHFNRFPYE